MHSSDRQHSKPGTSFAEMRAKARAGKFRGKTHGTDRVSNSPSTSASVAAKNVDLMRGLSTKGKKIKSPLDYKPRSDD
jgi:hypothetical protein